MMLLRGRALIGLGAIPGYRIQIVSEYVVMDIGSESVGDKVHRQKGDNPDQQLRSPSVY